MFLERRHRGRTVRRALAKPGDSSIRGASARSTPMRHAGCVVEIAALIVSGLSLVLQGLSQRREKVKDDNSAVRGLVALYHQLWEWQLKATNYKSGVLYPYRGRPGYR